MPSQSSIKAAHDRACQMLPEASATSFAVTSLTQRLFRQSLPKTTFHKDMPMPKDLQAEAAAEAAV